ncbi:MAG: hypothetical protein PHT40_03610 [Patescibacteria group bacterium]|nr:hypothetical protein [Patescibacteria group bacterium]
MENQNKNQTKTERFKKLAEARTNHVLKALKILGNCANRSLYDYEDEEVRKIFRAINEKIEETKGKFKYSEKEFRL